MDSGVNMYRVSRLLMIASLLVSVFAFPAAALDLTQRQIDVAGKLDMSSARKVVTKLMKLDAASNAPIYLQVLATNGTAQGVLMVADTIAAIESPVVAVVMTEVRGAGATLVPFADRVEIYPSAGFVFTEVGYEGVGKPKPEKKKKDDEAKKAKKAKKAEAPPTPDPHKQLLQEARSRFLKAFWGRVAKRIDRKPAKLIQAIEKGGFILTAKDALREDVADGRVSELRYAPLPVKTLEEKVTTSLKTTATPDAR
jgi:ATP-dependent protease ClpP protease subunit